MTRSGEPSIKDLLASVSVVKAKRRRPKREQRSGVTLEMIEEAELDKAIRQAGRELRGAGLSRSHDLARANQAREIAQIGTAAAEELAKPEPLPEELLDAAAAHENIEDIEDRQEVRDAFHEMFTAIRTNKPAGPAARPSRSHRSTTAPAPVTAGGSIVGRACAPARRRSGRAPSAPSATARIALRARSRRRA